jgi:hypothetical protein
MLLSAGRCPNENVFPSNFIRSKSWLQSALGCSWINQIEQRFSILARKRLRAPNFEEIVHLESAVEQFIEEWNEHACRSDDPEVLRKGSTGPASRDDSRSVNLVQDLRAAVLGLSGVASTLRDREAHVRSNLRSWTLKIDASAVCVGSSEVVTDRGRRRTPAQATSEARVTFAWSSSSRRGLAHQVPRCRSQAALFGTGAGVSRQIEEGHARDVQEAAEAAARAQQEAAEAALRQSAGGAITELRSALAQAHASFDGGDFEGAKSQADEIQRRAAEYAALPEPPFGFAEVASEAGALVRGLRRFDKQQRSSHSPAPRRSPFPPTRQRKWSLNGIVGKAPHWSRLKTSLRKAPAL